MEPEFPPAPDLYHHHNSSRTRTDSDAQSDSSFEVPMLDPKEKTRSGSHKSKSKHKQAQATSTAAGADPKRHYQPKGIFVDNVRKLTSEKIRPSLEQEGEGHESGSDGDKDSGWKLSSVFGGNADPEAQVQRRSEDNISTSGEEGEEETSTVRRGGCCGFLHSRKVLWFSLFTWIRILFVLCILITLILVLALLPVADFLVQLSGWVQAQGPIGPVLYTIFLVAWVIICLPTSAVELIAGFTFGFWVALLVSYIGKNIGCISAFLIGKSLGRNSVKKLLKRFRILRTFDRVISKNATKMVFLIRLAYMPIALKNYGLSFFAIKRRLFIISTLVCTVPETAVLAFFGSSADDILDLANGRYSGGTLGIVALAIGICFMIVVLVLIAYYTRVEWKKATEEVQRERQDRKARKAGRAQRDDEIVVPTSIQTQSQVTPNLSSEGEEAPLVPSTPRGGEEEGSVRVF